GVESIAVTLLFSYANPEHEQVIAAELRKVLGDAFPMSLSHVVAPQYGEYERTSTTVVNAYVMPVMRGYIESLERELRLLGIQQVHVMHSNGGLVSASAA